MEDKHTVIEDLTPPKVPTVRDDRGKFVKGISGNPGGRPKRGLPDGLGGIIGRIELFEQNVVEVRDKLLSIVRDPKAKHRDQIAAGNILLNRALGVPKQQINLSLEDDKEESIYDMDSLPLDVLEKLVLATKAEYSGQIIDVEPDSD